MDSNCQKHKKTKQKKAKIRGKKQKQNGDHQSME